MSRKTRKEATEQPADAATAPAPGNRRRNLVVGLVVAALVAALAFVGLRQHAVPETDPARQAALASEHSPTLGDATARVHIVEFLDPACETCAQFYPVVKQLMAENPGRIRLSLRHVAFHDGADFAVRALEASRAQDRYWQTLEALLASQQEWAPHHTVQPDLVLPVLARAGLDMDRLRGDMESPAITERMARDLADARTLQVAATPEFFVNGRPLPSFGYEQLLALVGEELDRAY